jgi:hypothetical protein
MKMNTGKMFIIVGTFAVLFASDRYLYMDNRIINNNWSFESGDYMGVDPIHFGQHCELRDNIVFFYEEKRELYVVGCYGGQLLLYDFHSEILTRYSEL